LVVQKILSVLDEADDPDLHDYYETMKDLPIHYNGDNDEALKEFESEENTFSEDDGEDSDEEFLREPEADGTAQSSGKKVLSALQKVSINSKKVHGSFSDNLLC